MKNQFLFLLLSVQLISCQSVYKNNESNSIMFLGEYNDNEEFKVYLNDSVQFVKRDSLEQINQYPTEEFIKVLDSFDLYFIGEGSEPFWDIKIKGNKAVFQSYTLPDDKQYKFLIETFVDKQSGTHFMFKSLNNKLFGIISNIDGKKNKEQPCSLSTTENYYVYEIYVTVNGKMYKGCAMIDEND